MSSGFTLDHPVVLAQFATAVGDIMSRINIELASFPGQSQLTFGQNSVDVNVLQAPHVLNTLYVSQSGSPGSAQSGSSGTSSAVSPMPSDFYANITTLMASLKILQEAATTIYKQYQNAQNLEGVSADAVKSAFASASSAVSNTTATAPTA